MLLGKSAAVVAAAGLLALATAAHVRPADACGMAYPPQSFIRMTGEETLIVWDAANKTEHFVRKPTFTGDPTAFGFFVPTPVTPAVEKVDPDTIVRVARLMIQPMPASRGIRDDAPGGAVAAAPPPVVVTQRVTVDDFEIVSLAATDANALGAWLSKNGFVDKPSLRGWWQPYVARGWIISAMRYAGAKDKKADTLTAPALRFSFATDKPYYPYTEPPPDPADERAFNERTGLCKPGQACTPKRDRKLDLYFVSHGPVRATIHDQPAGPYVTQVAEVEAARMAAALGETKTWKLDVQSNDRWTITHFVDTAEVRDAKSDVLFAAIGPELPPARGTAKPLVKKPRYEATPERRIKPKHILFGFVALLALFGVGLAFWKERG